MSISPVHLLGIKPGNVKNLGGFRKGFHKIPNAPGDAAFERQLAPMCAPDLEERARALFENLRTARGYKRREINLAIDAPSATLTTTDFTLDLLYALDPADAGDFRLTHDLHTIRDIAVFGDGGLNDVFAGVFNRVSLPFGESIDLENLIDELEDEPGGQANLTYPPDCSECRIRLPRFAGEVRVTAHELEIVAPSSTSPAELVQTFVAASEVLSANPTLSRLLTRAPR